MQTTEESTKTAKQQSTSILELMYLIRAKNKGEMSFAECFTCMTQWAHEVIEEHETGQRDAAPSHMPMQSSQGHDEGESQSYQ